MKTKLLVPMLGLLLLTGCSEDEEPVVKPTPAPQDLCYLEEQHIETENGDSTIRYTYNDQNQVVQTEHLRQEDLLAIRRYTYTSEGKLAEEHVLKPDSTEEMFMVYAYDSKGRLSRYEVKQEIPGLETVHRLSSFKAVYDNQGRLTSATDYLFLNNKERANGSVTISYPIDKAVVATVKGRQGETLYKATTITDPVSRDPLSAVPVYQLRKPGIGYPNQRLMTELNATNEEENVLEASFTSAYELNERGYPETYTVTYGDGREVKYTYTYRCSE
ncbi:hypothetical protein [Pontibacter mangrovi]|uniref:DUF4595 domain-containing protein n=1 Tax=Pontibacter mangrovi TaxID=2589816 RepID=A0A501WCC2_9BACT|nr:hypothetical protein [Pontibacter mangrovi]TPE46145.1 hypothetical protein FJM65_02020 [Pontibacter mangrovi]